MECLRPLKHWDRVFESHSRHGCVCVGTYSVPVWSCVWVAVLRRVDRSSRRSHHLCKKDYETDEEARAQQRAVEPLMNEK
jgi:hypothetical protein